VKTAAQAAANWAASAGRAATAWQEGVQAYSGDWAGATTRQQSAMVNNWTQAVSSGRWAQGVNNVGTAGWKADTLARATNFTTGFQAGAQKQAASAQKIMSFLATAVPNLQPRGDINANLGRSNALALALHAQKGNLGA
jgi:hypothetical protein